MNDIRRTLLWVVFSMSLVLIWDAWQRHNGQPSMFGPAPAAKPRPPLTGANNDTLRPAPYRVTLKLYMAGLSAAFGGILMSAFI